MRSIRRLTIAAAAAAALAAGVSGTASASEAPFGQDVSMCAHELGQRAAAPAVMTFATFGAMVQHMRDMR